MGIVGAICKVLQGERAEDFDSLLEILHCMETGKEQRIPRTVYFCHQDENHNILCTPSVDFSIGVRWSIEIIGGTFQPP